MAEAAVSEEVPKVDELAEFRRVALGEARSLMFFAAALVDAQPRLLELAASDTDRAIAAARIAVGFIDDSADLQRLKADLRLAADMTDETARAGLIVFAHWAVQHRIHAWLRQMGCEPTELPRPEPRRHGWYLQTARQYLHALADRLLHDERHDDSGVVKLSRKRNAK